MPVFGAAPKCVRERRLTTRQPEPLLRAAVRFGMGRRRTIWPYALIAISLAVFGAVALGGDDGATGKLIGGISLVIGLLIGAFVAKWQDRP